MKVLKVLFLILLTSGALLADEEKVHLLPLVRPIWTSGLFDPTWIFKKINRSKSIAVFDFSVDLRLTNNEEKAQIESEAGRCARSLSLYLGERLFIESDLNVVNYITYVQGLGPALKSYPEGGAELLSNLVDPADFILHGLIANNTFASVPKITIYLFNSETKQDEVLVEIEKTNVALSELSAEISKRALERIYTSLNPNRTDLGILFPRPQQKTLPNYLDGLGQLLVQNLVRNKLSTKENLRGEGDMLAWYRSLWGDEEDNNCIKLMYLNGVIASIDYGGSAYKNHLYGLKMASIMIKNRHDMFVLASPVLIAKSGNLDEFESLVRTLPVDMGFDYSLWVQNLRNIVQ